jgi:hypothetical protein
MRYLTTADRFAAEGEAEPTLRTRSHNEKVMERPLSIPSSLEAAESEEPREQVLPTRRETSGDAWQRRRLSLLRVVDAASRNDRLFFGSELIVKACLERLTQHPADSAVGARGSFGERGGEGGRLAIHGITWLQTRHQTEFKCFLCGQAAVKQE